ncbi:structural protein [Vibrio sp. 10N.286.49.C2]|uniref:structural protein n=1 Tax=unclassified Vibrio TaxID=2614977 RepID=UPI000C836FFB|nr:MULTISPECIES: structural protein [unclassified Vibrio]PMH40218.1 structural protein [Vibrio sp. 10N.286.49.C2]PMH46329.1 structural protein [Vibrio sp. 10N.286.49.B1]PMH82027.1 structural protein [Vibrio sp. 10N.286.48.B7]
MMRALIIIVLIGALMWGAPQGVKIVKSQLNRGIRNNNPLNIRISNNAWTGKVTPSQDKAFETFSDHKYGFRAAAKLVRNYQMLYGLNSINEIIGRWAPSHENDTANYSQFVAGQLNVSPNAALNLADNELLARLVHAMSIMEVGRYYSLSDAKQGVALV